MTKTEIIWLLIRIAGLYFIYQSIELVISSFGVYLVASETPGMVSKSAGVLLPSIIRIIFCAVLGGYLLTDGDKFIQMLNRRPEYTGQ